MKRYSVAKLLLWICAGALVGYVAWWVLPTFFKKEEDPRSQEFLNRIAAEINRSLPLMIDKETELLPSEGAPGMFIYKYRLVSYTVSQVDPKKFSAGAKGKLAAAACARPETRDEFLRKGVTLRYSYFDKNQQHIATIDVTPNDCGF